MSCIINDYLFALCAHSSQRDIVPYSLAKYEFKKWSDWEIIIDLIDYIPGPNNRNPRLWYLSAAFKFIFSSLISQHFMNWPKAVSSALECALEFDVDC